MVTARREADAIRAKARRAERALAVLSHLQGNAGNVSARTLWNQMMGVDDTDQVEHDYDDFADIIRESRERARKVK